MSDDVAYPLDDNEKKKINAEARKAALEARLAWAEENKPIDDRQAPGNVGVLATWLLTIKGKAGRVDVSFADVHKKYIKATVKGTSCEVRHYQGRSGPHRLMTTFNDSQAGSVEQLAITVARALCGDPRLDEVHEVNKATWSIYLQNVAMGSGYGPQEIIFSPGLMPRLKRTTNDDVLIAAMKALGHTRELSRIYNEKFEEVRDDLVEEMLADSDRAEKLRRKQARAETRAKVIGAARTGIAKLRSKDGD